MKIQVICENSVFRGAKETAEQGWNLLGEHGWCAFVVTEYGNYLMDTGLGNTLLANAKALGCDLKSIRGIVLSHHHIDHTGGLKAALSYIQREVPVYTHPDLFKESATFYQKNRLDTGIPFSRKELEALGARFVFQKEAAEIFPGAWLTGEIPRVVNFESADGELLTRNGEGDIWKMDPLLNDQALVFKTKKGLCILLGCAHSGLINTIEYAKKITEEDKIYCVMGGTHLSGASQERLDATFQKLKEYQIKYIGTAHCTGIRPMALMMREFSDQYFDCHVGNMIEI